MSNSFNDMTLNCLLVSDLVSYFLNVHIHSGEVSSLKSNDIFDGRNYYNYVLFYLIDVRGLC